MHGPRPHVGGYLLALRALRLTFAIMPAAGDTEALHSLQFATSSFDTAL